MGSLGEVSHQVGPLGFSSIRFLYCLPGPGSLEAVQWDWACPVQTEPIQLMWKEEEQGKTGASLTKTEAKTKCLGEKVQERECHG